MDPGSTLSLLAAMGEMLSSACVVGQLAYSDTRAGQRAVSVVGLEWMDTCHSLLGLPEARDITVLQALRRIERGDRREFLGALRRCIASGGLIRETLDLRDGVTRLRVTAQCTKPRDGRSQITVVFQDATDDRVREQVLHRELMRQGQMVEMAGIGTWTLDLASGALNWSDQVFKIHDMTPGPMPSVKEALAFYDPAESALVEEFLERLLRKEAPYDLVSSMVTATGRRIKVHGRAELICATDGTPTEIVGTFRDVTEEKKTVERLEASEQQLKFALDGSNDGLWDWNIASDEVYFSPRWKELIGHEDHELNDGFSEWATRVPEDAMPDIKAQLDACLSGETDAFHTEFQMRHKDGSWRWILSRAKVVERDEMGAPLRMVGTHTDITEQVELRRGLVTAKESAEQAAVAKSEFLATMSHEIRTPLNGILGLTELLLDTELNSEQSEHLSVIFRSGTALLEILNDILDLSKFEAGKIELESIPFSPVDCAENTMVLLEQRVAENKDLAMKLIVDESVPDAILGDPGRLRQILLNLVGNAVKFTEQGSIKVILSTLPRTDGSEDLRIAVHDTGIGISASKAKSLFESFTQADSSTTRRFGGTGLGLSISRKLVKLMGGTIACRPGLRGGSVFWIEIPVEPAEALPLPDRPIEGAAADRPSLHPAREVRVLVVEDNQVNEMVARRMLEKLGCDVTVVRDGAEAVAATLDHSFDVIFMDCQMPVMDGYEATRIIRAREAEAHVPRVPIIAMTANSMGHDRDACLKAGMDDYISKPVLIGVLEGALIRSLGRQRTA